MIELPVYLMKCSVCGKEANGNSREVDGWTLAPKFVCADCNGYNATPKFASPATEEGKFIYHPYGKIKTKKEN